MSNLENWNKLSRPPVEALKKILGGRLAGMTDVNPQWRLKIMTETFGQIGVGWYYDVIDMWTEEGAGGQKMAFVHINLFTKTDDALGWSRPISGIGGSMLVAQEKNGLHTSDEAFKMATTDALSVAMKQLGVAADIYAGLWDGSKYKDAPPEKAIKLPKLTDEEAEKAYYDWLDTKTEFIDHDGIADNDKIADAWGKLPSNVRSAIKRYGESIAPVQQNDAQTQQHIKDIK